MNGRVGQGIYGAAIVCFGATSLIVGNVVAGLEPVPATVPGRALIGYATGVILVVCGLAILANKRAAIASRVLALFLALWLLLLHVPRLVQHLSSGGAWTQASELLGIVGVALVLAAQLAEPDSGENNSRVWDRIGAVGRMGFAIALVIYGVQHFLYGGIVAGMIPGWIPVHLFFAYAVGVAFLAAGVSIATGIQARLAALLTGIMFGSWVIVLHIPRVAASRSEAEFTSMMIAVALCGGGLVLAQRKQLQ